MKITKSFTIALRPRNKPCRCLVKFTIFSKSNVILLTSQSEIKVQVLRVGTDWAPKKAFRNRRGESKCPDFSVFLYSHHFFLFKQLIFFNRKFMWSMSSKVLFVLRTDRSSERLLDRNNQRLPLATWISMTLRDSQGLLLHFWEFQLLTRSSKH